MGEANDATTLTTSQIEEANSKMFAGDDLARLAAEVVEKDVGTKVHWKARVPFVTEDQAASNRPIYNPHVAGLVSERLQTAQTAVDTFNKRRTRPTI